MFIKVYKFCPKVDNNAINGRRDTLTDIYICYLAIMVRQMYYCNLIDKKMKMMLVIWRCQQMWCRRPPPFSISTRDQCSHGGNFVANWCCEICQVFLFLFFTDHSVFHLFIYKRTLNERIDGSERKEIQIKRERERQIDI